MSENYFMGLDGFVWFTGVVEDRNDPDKLGRVRVRSLGFHTEDLNDIPTADLPWATVMHPVTNPSMQGLGQTPSFLVEGTWVVGFYTDAKEKQQPIIMGTLPGKPSTAPDDTKGFSDPNKVYPSTKLTTSGHGTDKDENNYSTETKFLESDTNRLARNDVDEEDVAITPHSILATKEEGRTKDVTIANTTDDQTVSKQQEWIEPASTYATVYPKNHVFETESGHVKEYDDTTDAERIHEYHKSGTFYEIDKDGNKTTRIIKDNYEIIAGSDYVNVKGTANLTIDSNCNTHIKGNWNIQVDGTKTEVVTGAVSETYKDTKTETVTKSVTETYNDTLTQAVTGLVSETYSASQTTNITGTLNLDASTEVDMDAATINLN